MANVPCPGVDPGNLERVFDHLKQNQGGGGDIVGMFNLFTGGALSRFAVGALGIMPYITASIIMSLLTPVLPQLERLKREGETGFQKINQYTRYLTLIICVIQGYMSAMVMEHPGSLLNLPADILVVPNPGFAFRLSTVVILTAGTLLLMWFGELITDRGIGQGASLIITIGIIEGLPGALYSMYDLYRGGGSGDSQFTLIHVLILLALFVLVTAATVAISVAIRKVPIQHARTRTSRGGAAPGSFFPLRLNFANVMPIIFASALLMFPPLVFDYLTRYSSKFSYLATYFGYGQVSYMLMYGALIILFSFFWVANQFNPIQIADDLKRNGAYVPGIRPGKPTADFLDWCMTRVTTAGAIFLTLIALLPMVLNRSLDVPNNIAHYLGGTSLLIIVGVMLDTMRQMESHLVQHGGYDGFLKHGRIKTSRRTRV
jgi:preprotein translocase subunit SecY